MELTGEKVLRAPRNDVYAMLHDPATLRQAIPGCQRFTQIDDTRYEAEIALKIGPISTTFLALITLYNDDAPMGFSMHGHADSGRTVGGADGNAHVALAMIDENTTNLAYHTAITPQGRVADLPDDVIDKKARTLTAEFFSRLQLLLDGGDVEPMPEPAPYDASARPGAASRERYGDEVVATTAAPAREAEAASATALETEAEWEADRQRAIAALRGSAPETASVAPAHSAAAEVHAYAGASDPADDTPEAVELPESSYRTIGNWQSQQKAEPSARSEGPSGIGRWVLVALGVCVIAYLMLDSF